MAFKNSYADLPDNEDVGGRSDFIESSNNGWQLSAALSRRLCRQLHGSLATLTAALASEHHGDLSVYTGSAGLVLLLVHMHKVHDSSISLHCCLPVCDRLMAVEVACGSAGRRQVSLVCGAAGGWAVAAVVYTLFHMSDKVDRCLYKIAALMCTVETDEQLANELLYGRAGYLACLLYLRQNGVALDNMDIYIKKTVAAMLTAGKRQASRDPGVSAATANTLRPDSAGISSDSQSSAPLMYTWHGKHYLGSAHGLAGIVTVLLQVADMIDSEDMSRLIRPTVDYLATLQLASGNFASSLQSRAGDRLVQWCHGAPGFAHLFCLAHQVFDDDRYLDIARQCCDVVWDRGLLRKGHGLCHGSAGNAYSFLHLYQITKEKRHLYRACCFADWCLESRDCPLADRPLSLFEGAAGLVYFLADIQQPNRAKYPAFIFNNHV